MSHIHISSPFVRSFVHSDYIVGTTIVVIKDAAESHEKRVKIVFQNKSATEVAEVILSNTATSGINVPAGGNFVIENYNGHIRVRASAAGVTVHLAIGSI